MRSTAASAMSSAVCDLSYKDALCRAVGAAVALNAELRAVTRWRSRLVAEEAEDELTAADPDLDTADGMQTGIGMHCVLGSDGRIASNTRL